VLSVTIPVSERAKPRKVSVSTEQDAPVLQTHESGQQSVEQ
jgi:HSP20 family protein